MTFLWGAIFLSYALVWAIAIARARRARSARPIGEWIVWQFLLIGAVAALVPLYWMITESMKPPDEAGRFPPTWLPESIVAGEWKEAALQTAENYKLAWNSPPGAMTFARYFWVSCLVGAATTAGVLTTSVLAAYALAKMRFAGRSGVFYAMLATLMVPGQVLIIPNYLTLERLGWLDRYPALIVPFIGSVFAIFLLRQFFMTVPDELWDAARIDGAGRFGFLWRVILPMAAPVLAAVAIFTFIGQWNALFWPLIATTRPEMRTLMVGLQSLNLELAAEPNLLYAAAAFTMAPTVVAFFFLQRFFIQSVARTGIRG